MPLMRYASSGAKGLILFSVFFFSLVLLGSLSSVARADTANLNLTLTITMPPQCTFSSGLSTQVVNFDEVQQGLIDGVSYQRKQINTGLSCQALEKNALNMTVTWDNDITLNGVSAVGTNRTNLGIAIFHDNTRLSNGASMNFTYGSPPNLYAAPVKPNGTMLTDAGEFTGVMAITLSYQ